MSIINPKYIPDSLLLKDKYQQKNMILKSKKMYKKHKYFTRKNLKSFDSKKSNHILNAKKLYKVNKISASNVLSTATGCSKKTLKKIINKGMGAYYSSGSRPNQTPQSWGIARLASSITAGNASVIDYDLLKNGCKKNSKALKLANQAMKKHNIKTRRNNKH
jgi:CRISPR/Cas system CSM-associated protein Csm4 (group 5 of RAMP superfamily)